MRQSTLQFNPAMVKPCSCIDASTSIGIADVKPEARGGAGMLQEVSLAARSSAVQTMPSFTRGSSAPDMNAVMFSTGTGN